MSLIIVPYRDSGNGVRKHHLSVFLDAMSDFEVPILVVEQSQDGRKFNRGALLNIGVRESKESSLILHDVDLLPDPSLYDLYRAPAQPTCAEHLGKLWTTKYTFPEFFGGVVKVPREDMLRANGFPNQCWGWGGEDDCLRERLLRTGTRILLPTSDKPEGLYVEQPHDHQNVQGLRNDRRWEDKALYSHDLSDGISTLRYTVQSKQSQGLSTHMLVELQ